MLQREKRRAKKAAKGESAEGGKDAEGAAEEGDGEKDAAAKPSFSDKFGGFMKDLSESEAGKAVSDAAGKVSEAASQTKEALEKEAADSAAEEKKTGKKQGKKGKDGMVTSAVKETVTEVAKEFTESDEGKRASPYQVRYCCCLRMCVLVCAALMLHTCLRRFYHNCNPLPYLQLILIVC